MALYLARRAVIRRGVSIFSAPVRGVDGRTFTLTDSRGTSVPARVDQIGDSAWGLFANDIVLTAGEVYAARLRSGVCDMFDHCSSSGLLWHFRVASNPGSAMGNTSLPNGFSAATRSLACRPPQGKDECDADPPNTSWTAGPPAVVQKSRKRRNPHAKK